MSGLKRVGVLAVQGAFIEHIRRLEELGASCVELRQRSDVMRAELDGLVLPGGESTTQAKLLRELEMRDPLRSMIGGGLPVLATCAGMILLAAQVRGQGVGCLGTMDIEVERNAYGRQLDSFHTEAAFEDLGALPLTFIRAPSIVSVGEAVRTLATVDGRSVAVRQGDQIAVAFHPELDSSDALHRLFLEAGE
jgi:pyridoxal 5'-phosphate synthase pdxT subunit